MFGNFFKGLNNKPEETPQEYSNKTREEIRKENITPGFPKLSASVSERAPKNLNRPNNFVYGTKKYKDLGDGNYVNEDDSTDLLPYVAAYALFSGLENGNSADRNNTSENFKGDGGNFGGGGSSGGFSSIDDHSNNPVSIDGGNDAGGGGE